MRIRFYLFLFFLISHGANAQKYSFELWHEGKIVLIEGDTLKGLVKYDLQQDLVQYNIVDKRVEAFTPRKVLFFEIYDATIHKYRQFFSLPFTATGGYEAPKFFELLEEGKITLLAREALEMQTYSSPYYVGSYSRQVLVNQYYILDERSGIQPFIGKKKDLLDLMEKKSEEIEKYIKANHLDFDNKYDLAKIVEYYNSLYGS